MPGREYETVTIERIGPVERITLNRPEKRNARNTTLQREIAQVHGYCIAGGSDLALHCDLVIMADDALIGLALEAVPADALEARVMELAEHIAEIPHDLLGSNKRIVNLGVDMMGRNQMQMVAAMNDTLAHLAPEVQGYSKALRKKGVAAAARERDAKFDK